ncbi:hypothetical protein [uncultured Ilyobacter sp.]|uniref:hypothetical protein n=1 Tax=uncultured Ilyobacter sp. TaxID=544433 RepID=UPI0029C6766E|nr:hypothetical protein [uncultured Ilyobacter sp.]
MELLKKADNLEYYVEKGFSPKYLEPIAKNVLWKIRNKWDDYNEVSHCCRFIESIRESHDIWIETHFIKNGFKIVGVLFVTGGKVDLDRIFKVKLPCQFQDDKSITISYFHIVPEVRGIGEEWLRQIVIPYYKEIGIEEIFIKSSHLKAFSLYNRLGKEIEAYTTQSDNRLYSRKGKVFQIKI